MKVFTIIAFILLTPCLAAAQPGTYTIIFLNKKTTAETLSKHDLDKIMAGHLANIKRLAQEKKLLAAGPFEGGGGILILNTSRLEEARQWIATDPGIQADRWNVEVLPYTPRYGSICTVSEPYQMTSYTLVRFDALVTKFTAQDFPEIIAQHDAYLKTLIATGNIITEAIFGIHDGGILIIQGTLQQEVIEADPAVQQELLNTQTHTLWIAKGSFCEK